MVTKTIDLTYDDLVDALYMRLSDVRRALDVRVMPDDEFDLGINCRAANEEMWLQELLDSVEKSR
jgi:hypothetical protein